MSNFTDLRDKLASFAKHLFDLLLPVGEHVLQKTAQDVAAAALDGKVHGSHDMIDVAKKSLQEQAPELKATVSTIAAALLVDHLHQEDEQAKNAPLNQPPVNN